MAEINHTALRSMTIKQLRALAKVLEVPKPTTMSKAELIAAIIAAAKEAYDTEGGRHDGAGNGPDAGQFGHGESEGAGEERGSGDADADQIDDPLRVEIAKVAAGVVKKALENAPVGGGGTRTIVVRDPVDPEGIDVGATHPAFRKVLELASQRLNVMLVGPAGCGKTYLAEKVAEALGLPFSSVSCSIGMSESQITGWLLPMGEGGSFEYVPAEFVNRYENGGVFLLDEIDAADANLLVVLNSALANGYLFLPQRTDKPKAVKHDDFVLIAAANTFGNGADREYVGRNQLDAATLDRFRAGVVMMDYDPSLEEALIPTDVLEWGRKIRQRIRELGLRRIMSTRAMLDMAKMAKAYPYTWGKPEAWNEAYFADWPEDEKESVLSA